MLKLHVLASGSKGNAAIVENAETGAGVLIDCGICKRDFLERCDEAGFDPARLEAVFITHEHGTTPKGWAWCCAVWLNSVARQWYT